MMLLLLPRIENHGSQCSVDIPWTQREREITENANEDTSTVLFFIWWKSKVSRFLPTWSTWLNPH
ncbi:unnamed protein product, partial [Brassica oleracea var. botrytis]